MYVFAAVLIALMIITFGTTKERITPKIDKTTNLKSELFDLSKNLPYIIYRY